MESIDQIIQGCKDEMEQSRHFFIAWLTERVIIGLWSDDKGFEYANKDSYPIDWQELISLRIFSNNDELHIYRYRNTIKYRLNKKPEGDNTFVQEPYMWCSKVNPENCIYEPDRGMKFNLPFKVNSDQLPLRYRVINYFEYNELGQIEFYDARLSDLLDSNHRPLEVLNG